MDDCIDLSPNSDCSSWSYTLSTVNATTTLNLSTIMQDASWSASDGSDWVDSLSWNFEIADNDFDSPDCVQSSTLTKSSELFTPHLPTSPKPPKKLTFDLCSVVKDEIEGWKLSKVMELRGCKASFAKEVHRLSVMFY